MNMSTALQKEGNMPVKVNGKCEICGADTWKGKALCYKCYKVQQGKK